MFDYTTTLRQLCGIMSIAGFERRAAEEIRSLFGDAFDEITTDGARNIILLKKSKKPGVSKRLIFTPSHSIGITEVLIEICLFCSSFP